MSEELTGLHDFLANLPPQTTDEGREIIAEWIAALKAIEDSSPLVGSSLGPNPSDLPTAEPEPAVLDRQQGWGP